MRRPVLTLNGIMVMVTSGYSITWFNEWKKITACKLPGLFGWQVSICDSYNRGSKDGSFTLFSSFLLPEIVIKTRPNLYQHFRQGSQQFVTRPKYSCGSCVKVFNVSWRIVKMVLCSSVDETTCARRKRVQFKCLSHGSIASSPLFIILKLPHRFCYISTVFEELRKKISALS